MKYINIYILAMLLAFVSVGCKEKKETSDIIVPIQKVEEKKGPQSMSSRDQKEVVTWLGAKYTIVMARRTNKELPMVEDENGQKYYDNDVVVNVYRADGSVAITKTFTKAAFAGYLEDSPTASKGGLLGVVFDKVEDDCLHFAASVGSPDELSDEFVPFLVKIDRNGAVFITREKIMEEEYEDDGV